METLIGELYLTVELYDSIEFGHVFVIPTHLNGSKCIIKRNGSEIIGQMDASISFSGSLIQISNPSNNKWIEYLNAELTGRQLQVSGSITHNNNATYQQLRLDSQSAVKSTYTIEYMSGESFSAYFVPTGLTDASPAGDKLTSSFTLISSGAVARISAE